MSPETFSGKVTEKSDIFSLGCLMHEFCSLKKLFDVVGNDPEKVKAKILTETPARIPPFYSNSLAKIVKLMLSRNPAHRPSADQIFGLESIQRTYHKLISREQLLMADLLPADLSDSLSCDQAKDKLKSRLFYHMTSVNER